MSGGGTQSVRVELKWGDFRQFYWGWMRRSPWFWIATICLSAAIAIYLMLGLEAPLEKRNWFALIFVIIVVLWFLFLFLFLLPFNQLRRPDIRPPSDVTVGPEHLSHKNNLFEVHIAWGAFRQVEESSKLIFLTLVGSGGVYIIPKRSFPSSEAAQRFLDDVRRYWQTARKQS